MPFLATITATMIGRNGTNCRRLCDFSALCDYSRRFQLYSRQNGDYSQSSFSVTTVAENGDKLSPFRTTIVCRKW